MFCRPGSILKPAATAILILLTCIAVLSLRQFEVAAEERLADEVVASVNTSAITRSQVVQETRIILVQKGQNWASRLSLELLDRVLQRLIGKELIYQEMDRINSAVTGRDSRQIDSLELNEKFRAHFTDPDEYERFIRALGMNASSFSALLLRNAKIEKFMERRLKLLSRVTEEEIDNEIGKLRANDRAVQSVPRHERERVRLDLERKKYSQALKKWLKDLERRNRVLLIGSFVNDEAPVAIPDSNLE